MKAALHATVIAVLTVALPPLASAQEGPGKACKADREKFCAGMNSGDGKVGECLKQHEAELSSECMAARQAAQEARKAIRVNCKADAEKFCADTPKEHGGLAKCLEGHANEVGQACADALKSRPGAKKPA